MTKSLLAGVFAFLTVPTVLPGCGGSAAAPEARPAAAPAADPADDAAARAAWDAAFKHRFAGDELAARAALIQLAAKYPDTRYGSAAGGGGGGEAMVGVATVGVLAAVAVPAFMTYLKRSKSSEASIHLRRLHDAATAYHATECARLGKRCAKQFKFPASTPLSPDTPACLGGDSAARPTTPADWQHPTWKALGFAPTEPTLYQYQFVSAGVGQDATFTARALGDLDCDGVFSTFERAGALDGKGGITSAAGLQQQDELE